MTIRILIADNQAVVRQGLRAFLGRDDEIEVVGEARDGAEAVSLAIELEPDIVLMDLLMPGMSGIAATEAIRRQQPATEVIGLTSVLDDKLIFDAIRVGAMGYLLKDTQADPLCKAIKAAAAGQVQLSPEAVARLIDQVCIPDSREALTPRETEVLRLVGHAMSNKEIGYALGITEKTVKAHVSSILSKLGIPGRTDAALYAVRVGLVALDDIHRGS